MTLFYVFRHSPLGVLDQNIRCAPGVTPPCRGVRLYQADADGGWKPVEWPAAQPPPWVSEMGRLPVTCGGPGFS